MTEEITKCYHIYGIVQGVGFRPTVSRHAASCGVRGTVSNKGPYVEIIAQGSADAVARFRNLVEEAPPTRAFILNIEEVPWPPGRSYTDFEIVESRKTKGAIYISPDIAICDTCKQELYDPKNRRYLHPFINCTCCGPRLTILDALPYDRERTSMKEFPMCPRCAAEYTDPASRRYDAQPVCCHDCGPQVYLIQQKDCRMKEADAAQSDIGITEKDTEYKQKKNTGSVINTNHTPEFEADVCRNVSGAYASGIKGREAITFTRKVIRSGGIAAIKGIGGFHLCCDATNDAAVSLLRTRKRRPMKPLAVMARDLDAARAACEISQEQEKILDGHQKPILLLKKRRNENFPPDEERSPASTNGMGRQRGKRLTAGNCAGRQDDENLAAGDASGLQGDKSPASANGFERHGYADISPLCAPDNPKIGLMLPYAPLHLLLFDYDDGIDMPDYLVMTSANTSGAPICRDDEDAVTELADLCDVMLSHERLIRIRADDTVMDFYRGAPYMVRRSRGYAPLPVSLHLPVRRRPKEGADAPGRSAAGVQIGKGTDLPSDVRAQEKAAAAADGFGTDHEPSPGGNAVLAIGGELKNTFCIGIGELFYLSPYVGDLEDIRTVGALKETVRRFETLLEVEPDVIACDMHPLYHSAETAKELAAQRKAEVVWQQEMSAAPVQSIGRAAGWVGDISNYGIKNPDMRENSLLWKETCSERTVRLHQVQHHYAHVLSCMAENDFFEPVIGISYDGTGYGTDGSIWGGEMLLSDLDGFRRTAYVKPFLQIGGDAGVREGWRIAAGLICQLFPEEPRTKSGTDASFPDGTDRWDSADAGPDAVPDGHGDCASGSIPSAIQVMERLSLCSVQEAKVTAAMVRGRVNAVRSTSCGRLFDAVCAILGIRRISTFEGEAATALQFAAEAYAAKAGSNAEAAKRSRDSSEDAENVRVGRIVSDASDASAEPFREADRGDIAVRNDVCGLPDTACQSSDHLCGSCQANAQGCIELPTDVLLRTLILERLSGADAEELAWWFHRGLADLTVQAAVRIREETGVNTAALTGGVFQNTLLLRMCEDGLAEEGFRVLRHHLVPPNDGGIALGQAVSAAYAARQAGTAD